MALRCKQQIQKDAAVALARVPVAATRHVKFLAVDNKLGGREIKLFASRTARERFAVVESDDCDTLKRHADEVSRACKRDSPRGSRRRLVRTHRLFQRRTPGLKRNFLSAEHFGCALRQRRGSQHKSNHLGRLGVSRKERVGKATRGFKPRLSHLPLRHLADVKKRTRQGQQEVKGLASFFSPIESPELTSAHGKHIVSDKSVRLSHKIARDQAFERTFKRAFIRIAPFGPSRRTRDRTFGVRLVKSPAVSGCRKPVGDQRNIGVALRTCSGKGWHLQQFDEFRCGGRTAHKTHGGKHGARGAVDVKLRLTGYVVTQVFFLASGSHHRRNDASHRIDVRRHHQKVGRLERFVRLCRSLNHGSDPVAQRLHFANSVGCPNDQERIVVIGHRLG